MTQLTPSPLKHPFRPIRPGHIMPAALFASFLLCGCIAKFSPLEPISPPARTLEDIAVQLDERSPTVQTCFARGDLVLSGADVDGKKSVIVQINYERPNRLRFRASRLAIGTVFDLYQEGPLISLKQGKRIYRGTVADLASMPEFAGGFEPLEIVRAILVEEELRRAIRFRGASGLDTSQTFFDGETLDFYWPNALTGHNETFTIRRRDGLVSRVAIELPPADGRPQRRYTIRYLKYALEDGAHYPSRFEFISEKPRIKLRVDVEKIRFNPEILDKGFEIDSRGCEILPLTDILRPKP